MPPTSNSVSASSKPKSNRYSVSPDSEPATSEPPQPAQPISSKKKKKNAASKQAQNINIEDLSPSTDVVRPESPPTTRPQTILSQLGRGFPASTRSESPLLDIQDDEIATTEKVSDQYTPPNDVWLEAVARGKLPPVEQAARVGYSTSPPVEPGFSTRARYESKSPPISPPVRYARPVSYSGGAPPVPALPRASPSAYTYASSAYGSPPAPHLPQPHFYHAQDVNIGVTRSAPPLMKEDPALVRYVRLPPSCSSSGQGIVCGFEGRLNVLRAQGGSVDEIGVLSGLRGTVVDAVLLEGIAGSDSFAAARPLVAVVLHGRKEYPIDHHSQGVPDDTRSASHQHPMLQSDEYTTRVEVISMVTHECLAILLETPAQVSQSAFRGMQPTPPNPIGNLSLETSGRFLIVSSGVSGEVFVFDIVDDPQPGFACLGKYWTSIQPQIQRRDSSHHRSSDVDISPADLGRAAGSVEKAISSLNGRWLAICPATSPSRPSLGAVIGPNVLYGRHSGIEATSAPARPSVTCEVDSPDADTLFGKVARGVAQELVKGAKWLGDQGYQTWQSYWKKDQSPSASGTSSAYTSPPTHPLPYAAHAFPPTHGEASRTSKEPELVAIYDLQANHDSISRKGTDDGKPLATFQPPRGCSFLSFAPHGLTLLTGGRKGDVQYVWDLMQIKNCRTRTASVDDERARFQPRVRQVAKFERLSGSTIVDVVWDAPTSSRFAVLTKNKTVHLFDLPISAFRWPPPRMPNKSRPTSRSMDTIQQDAPVPSGFFASAMNIANQAQPMLANWRGRAPSMSGGLAGIGQTGIGLASATGARGSKAVAAGLSKSLGAASETVQQIRHAGESRLHLRSSKEVVAGKISWAQVGRTTALTILEADFVKQYQLRRHKIQEKRDRDDVTVFAARKAANVKLPVLTRMDDEVLQPVKSMPENPVSQHLTGFWKAKPDTGSVPTTLAHPLSFAEIETNAPYQPFHSDRRVVLSIYSNPDATEQTQLLTVSTLQPSHSRTKSSKPNPQQSKPKWVFGDDIPTTTLNISKLQIPEADDEYTGSVIYRETIKVSSPAQDEGMDEIVSTTRRRKVKKGHTTSHDGSDVEKEDGFFEDDCDVLDFATDRV